MTSPLLRRAAAENVSPADLTLRIVENADLPPATLQRIADEGPRLGDEEVCSYMATVLLTLKTGGTS
jgi:hypothetical protein